MNCSVRTRTLIAATKRHKKHKMALLVFCAFCASLWLCLFLRRNNHIPPDFFTQLIQHAFRDYWRHKPELIAHQLLNINSHVLEHPEQLTHLFPTVNFNERPRIVIAELDHTAHDFLRRSPAQKLKPEHASPQNDLDPVVQRVAMIEHHFRCPSWPQHAMNFAYRSSGIRRVMKDAVRVDHVETLRLKRQAFAIRDHEVSLSAVEPETMPRDLDRARRQIDAGASRATTRKLQQVRSHPTTNLKQSRTTKLLKLHQPRHPRRVFLITIALDFIEKLARPELVLAVVFGATRILPPLLTRPEFFLY